MQRTVSIPVDLPSDRFLPLLAECAEVFNRHADWALAAHTYSKAKAHQALYEEQRPLHPDVPSALIQTVRDTALEAVKAVASTIWPSPRRARPIPIVGCALSSGAISTTGRRSKQKAQNRPDGGFVASRAVSSGSARASTMSSPKRSPICPPRRSRSKTCRVSVRNGEARKWTNGSAVGRSPSSRCS